MFQSTPLREGRPARPKAASGSRRCFNPRPCARGDPDETLNCPAENRFNPRPCARGDPPRLHSADGAARFNPRPCARGDIHVRARGRARMCFNPRPCARGDLPTGTLVKLPPKFQSTPLREGRRHNRGVRDIEKTVSIHAPARGATTAQAGRDCRRLVSIHAPARGATATSTSSAARRWFQSTPLREGRRPRARGVHD